MVAILDAAVLLMLYHRTGGAAWNINTGWLDSATPACQWHGVTCDGSGNVTAVELGGNGLRGVVPSELGLLISLRNLSFGHWDYFMGQPMGNSLSGAIPTQLARLQCLSTLAVGYNSLGGGIPTQLGGLTDLIKLNVAFNSLGGAIPTQLGGLTGLTTLHAGENRLGGAIPTQLGGLTGLTSLNVGSNSLGGAIPTQLGGLTGLTGLYVDQTSLSGAIPSQLGGLTVLTDLYLLSNSLSGAIPTQLGGLTVLTTLLVLSNSLSGAIPTQLGGLTGLTFLSLRTNRFTYPPPSEVHDMCSNLTVSCHGLDGCMTASPCDGAAVDGGLCQNALHLCTGAADCSAFKQAIPSLADPTRCSACDHGAELLVLLPVALLLFACTGLALLRRVARKHPQHVRRWLSTATIVYYHCLNVTLVSSIKIDWPPTMRRLARTLSLEAVLLLPGLECAVTRSEYASPDEDLVQSAWIQSTQVVIAIFLCLALTRNTTNSMRWLCLVLIFIFLGMWRAMDRLVFIAIIISSTTGGSEFAILCGFLGVLLCCLSLVWAFRLRFHVNAYARGLATGEWPWRSPLELDRRLAYLTHRFASHAPNWQFTLWLRQLLMLIVGSRAISVALETGAAACNDLDTNGETSEYGSSCAAVALGSSGTCRTWDGSSGTDTCGTCASWADDSDFTSSTMCCACGGGTPAPSAAVLGALLSALPWVQLGLSLLIVTVSLVWHHKRQPYAFASQNTLESGLLFSVVLLLLLAIPYHAMATADGTVSPALDAAMTVLVLGSLVGAALFVVLDWRRQQKDGAPLSLDEQLIGAAIP